jgi:hypothetical protein
MGPRRVHSAALSPLQETTVVEFRRRTLLPLDDVLGCLREQLPALSRSALHRCLLRHGSPGISRLPPSLERASKRGRFAETTLSATSTTSTSTPRRYDQPRAGCTSSLPSTACPSLPTSSCTRLHPRATMLTGAAFLRRVVKAFPYAIHTVLTDNGESPLLTLRAIGVA